MADANYIRGFRELGLKDVPLVGGKTASLGELYTALTPKGINVPDGFAVTAAAYRDALEESACREQLGHAPAPSAYGPSSSPQWGHCHRPIRGSAARQASAPLQMPSAIPLGGIRVSGG